MNANGHQRITVPLIGAKEPRHTLGIELTPMSQPVAVTMQTATGSHTQQWGGLTVLEEIASRVLAYNASARGDMTTIEGDVNNAVAYATALLAKTRPQPVVNQPAPETTA